MLNSSLDFEQSGLYKIVFSILIDYVLAEKNSNLNCLEAKQVEELINRVLGIKSAPILEAKYYKQPSVFKPKNLLREARRQLGVSLGSVPDFVVLDPDGDILDYLAKADEATLNPFWACYHTKLYEFKLGGSKLGIIGRAGGIVCCAPS